MENAILIIVALLLGYGQGVKVTRKKVGKNGGVIHHFKEKFSRKWQIIREQDEEIWKLKEEIANLQRKNEKQNDIFYSKGNATDLEKELFTFILHNEKRLVNGMFFLFYLKILNRNIKEVNDQKYTEYVYQETFRNINGIINADFIEVSEINGREYLYDFQSISKGAKEFIKEFNDFNYDVTFKEVEKSLCFIIKLLISEEKKSL